MQSFTRRPAFALLAIAGILNSCEPTKRPDVPSRVSPASLVRTYRDTPDIADSAYSGQLIVCYLPAGSYSVAGGEVHWSTGLPNAPPAVLFDFDGPNSPANNRSDLQVTGTCRGRFIDGRRREVDVYFYVRVSHCRYSSNPPSREGFRAP